MARHGDDVDDGALDLLALHYMDGILDEEEGRPYVDRHHGVKEFLLRVPDGATIRDSGGIHQRVNTAKSLVCCGYYLACVFHAGKISFNKKSLYAFLFQIGRNSCTVLFITPRDHNTFATAICEKMGNGFSKTLGGASDNSDLAIHRQLRERVHIHCETFTGLPVFHDSVAASASFCACRPS
jgi:hypothetical protein